MGPCRSEMGRRNSQVGAGRCLESPPVEVSPAIEKDVHYLF